jgi:hypothetical protein
MPEVKWLDREDIPESDREKQGEDYPKDRQSD